uniref:Uncharacterized protein n=1 Tax=Timema monikensis TaxID=170555 RepID=A0A7R9HNI3_9NEOP|nr:unnamed protein product [Timema monikensis]
MLPNYMSQSPGVTCAENCTKTWFCTRYLCLSPACVSQVSLALRTVPRLGSVRGTSVSPLRASPRCHLRTVPRPGSVRGTSVSRMQRNKIKRLITRVIKGSLKCVNMLTSGLTRPPMYPFTTGQYPYPMLSPEMSQVAASWHTPSMYPISTGGGFRTSYPTSLPITSTSLPSDFYRFSPTGLIPPHGLSPHGHHPSHPHSLASHPAIVTPGPKQELGAHPLDHNHRNKLTGNNSPAPCQRLVPALSADWLVARVVMTTGGWTAERGSMLLVARLLGSCPQTKSSRLMFIECS